MKISDRLTADNLARFVRSGEEELQKLQRQITTGRKLNAPSDDAEGYGRALRAKEGQVRAAQHKATTDVGDDMLDAATKALTSAHDVLTRAKELAMSAASPTMTSQAREAAAKEVDGLRAQLQQLRKAQSHGEPVFLPSGRERKLEVAPGVTAVASADGDAAFAGTVDLDASLAALSSEIRTGDAATLAGRVDNLGAGLGQLEQSLADAGAAKATMQVSSKLADDAQLDFQAQLQDVVGADPVESLARFTARQTALQTALSVGTKLLQPVLADKI